MARFHVTDRIRFTVVAASLVAGAPASMVTTVSVIRRRGRLDGTDRRYSSSGIASRGPNSSQVRPRLAKNRHRWRRS
jgi:hypothetical protein